MLKGKVLDIVLNNSNNNKRVSLKRFDVFCAQTKLNKKNPESQYSDKEEARQIVKLFCLIIIQLNNATSGC